MRALLPGRRRALAGGAALVAMAQAAPARATGPGLDAVLRGVLPHRASAAAIGRAWLADAGGAPPDPGVLAAALGRHDTAASFHRQVREDFAAGRVVPVDGWILSLTEARACALVALETAGLHVR